MESTALMESTAKMVRTVRTEIRAQLALKENRVLMV
jgi:hypothetical protein